MTNFEKDFNKRFSNLSIRLEKLENKLQGIIIKSLKNPRSSNVYWNKVKAEVNEIYAEMINTFHMWSKKELPLAYKRSLTSIIHRIDITKSIIEKASKGYYKVVNSRMSAQIMQGLYREAFESFSAACSVGRKNLFTFLRKTQQTLINEGMLDITIATGFELGNLDKAIGALDAEFIKKLSGMVEEKQFVQAGRYKYKPKYYAELVARTKFIDAHSEATLAQAANYDTDLVQVSSHNTTTRICQPFEGKIFSVSGKDKRFPALFNTPPYHCQCLHLIYPTFVSALEVQGRLDSFSAFSLGKTSRPPMPSNFIPVGSRGVA